MSWESVGCREVKCLPWSHSLSPLISIFMIWSHTPLFLLIWKQNQTRIPMFIRSSSLPVTPTKKSKEYNFSKYLFLLFTFTFYFFTLKPWQTEYSAITWFSSKNSSIWSSQNDMLCSHTKCDLKLDILIEDITAKPITIKDTWTFYS